MYKHLTIAICLLTCFFSINAHAIFEATLAPHVIYVNHPNAKVVEVVGSQAPDQELVALVEGEMHNYSVKYKIQKYGMWFNSSPYKIEGMRNYYNVFATSNMLYSIYPLPEIIKFHLDPSHYLREMKDLDASKYMVIEKFKKTGLYKSEILEIEKIGEHFFRFYIMIPNDIQLGKYTVKIYSTKSEDSIELLKELVFEVKNDSRVMEYAEYFRLNKLYYALSCIMLGVLIGIVYGVLFNFSNKSSQ